LISHLKLSSSRFSNDSPTYNCAENSSFANSFCHHELTSFQSSSMQTSSSPSFFSSSSSSPSTRSLLTFCLFDELNSNIKRIESVLEEDCEQMQYKNIDRLVHQHFDSFSKVNIPKTPPIYPSRVYYLSEPTNRKRTRAPIYKKRTTSLKTKLVRTKSYYYHQIHRKRQHFAYNYNCQMRLFDLKQRILINRLRKKVPHFLLLTLFKNAFVLIGLKTFLKLYSRI
jgi:hypothetical protein